VDTQVAQVPKKFPNRYWLQLTVLTVMLQGCAGQMVYSTVSAVSMAVTGKGVPEHGASAATGADCSMLNWLFRDRDYPCELPREPDVTYNRNVF